MYAITDKLRDAPGLPPGELPGAPYKCWALLIIQTFDLHVCVYATVVGCNFTCTACLSIDYLKQNAFNLDKCDSRSPGKICKKKTE